MCLGVDLAFEGQKFGHQPRVPDVGRQYFVALAVSGADKIVPPVKAVIRLNIETLVLDGQQMHMYRRRGDSFFKKFEPFPDVFQMITPAELALGYRRLALNSGRRGMEAILAGLEDAVEFGTAQRAKVAGVTVAGKTGSIHSADGAAIAWFAGFAPSRQPAVAVAVMLQGRSGGADAAPIAARILQAHSKGRL